MTPPPPAQAQVADARPDEPAGSTAPTGPSVSDWVDAGGGLSLRLELPAGPYHAGDRLTVRLHFRNDGPDPMRVYVIGHVALAYGAMWAMLRGWQVSPTVNLSLRVQNLFDRGHAEFDAAASASRIPRSVFVGLEWRPN